MPLRIVRVARSQIILGGLGMGMQARRATFLRPSENECQILPDMAGLILYKFYPLSDWEAIFLTPKISPKLLKSIGLWILTVLAGELL